MTKARPGTRERPWLAYLKHRRWWIWNVEPIGPGAQRITEDGILRVCEDGIYLRETEGAA
jgi:hypothetical protein